MSSSKPNYHQSPHQNITSGIKTIQQRNWGDCKYSVHSIADVYIYCLTFIFIETAGFLGPTWENPRSHYSTLSPWGSAKAGFGSASQLNFSLNWVFLHCFPSFHRHWPQEYALISVLCAKLHLNVWFLRKQTSDKQIKGMRYWGTYSFKLLKNIVSHTQETQHSHENK